MAGDPIFGPEAQEDLIDATDWYEAREPGLGADFLRCVDAAVQRIARNPESYPVVHRNTRMALVRRFPYLIIYRIATQGIIIVAVFHASRDPATWKKR
jgi:plasmid stabilization system protein ParE